MWRQNAGEADRPDDIRQQLQSTMDKCRYDAKLCLQAMDTFEAGQAVNPTATQQAVVAGRRHFIELGEQLLSAMKDLGENFRNSYSSLRTRRIKATAVANGVAGELMVNPSTHDVPWAIAAEDLHDHVHGGTMLQPFSAQELLDIVLKFDVAPVLCLEQLIKTSTNAAKYQVRDCANQLVQRLPVIAVLLTPLSGRLPARNVQIVSLPNMATQGSNIFWSLLSMVYCDYKVEANDAWTFSAGDTDAEQQEDEPERAEGDDTPPGKHRGPGHPRLEETFGEAIVTFVRNFVFSKGQPVQDHHRLTSSQSVYAAPLHLVASAAQQAGFPSSASGIKNLLTPRRKDSVGTQRGLVPATFARTSKCFMKWHSRDFWSATLFKWALQSLTIVNSRFPGSAGQAHMDDMAKIPYLSAARPRSNPKGLILKREDRKPAFAEQDHDFSIGQNMYINTTGVFTVAVPENATPMGTEKPQIAVGTKRAVTNLYLRPHRYVPVSDHTHMADFQRVVQDSPQLQGASLMVLGVDNGPGFSIDSAAIQHLFYREWRRWCWAQATLLAQAPDHSSYHHQAEGGWVHPRRAVAGHHFGRTAYIGDALHSGDDIEEVCQKVSAAGLTEYHNVLLDMVSRQKLSNYHIQTIVEKEPPGDIALVHEYYSCGQKRRADPVFDTIRAEAADFGDHAFKLPSFLQVTMDDCEMCRAATSRRRARQPDWDAQVYLSHLRDNGGRLYIPTTEETRSAAPASASASSAAAGPAVERPEVEAQVREPPSDANPAPARSPYPSFHSVLAAGGRQRAWKIPVNSYAKLEKVHACDKVAGCMYWSKTKAEKDRHCVCHHPALKPIPDPSPEVAAPPALVPPVSLEGAIPVLPPKKKQKVSGSVAVGEEAAASSAAGGEEEEHCVEEADPMVPIEGLGEEELVMPDVLREAGGTRIPSHDSLKKLVPGQGMWPGLGLIKLRGQPSWRGFYKHDFPAELAEDVDKKMKQHTCSRSWSGTLSAEGALRDALGVICSVHRSFRQTNFFIHFELYPHPEGKTHLYLM